MAAFAPRGVCTGVRAPSAHQRRPAPSCVVLEWRRQQHGLGAPGGSRHRVRLQPCQVTNTSDEIYRGKGLEPPDGDMQEDLLINEVQVHNPELGVLENRISKQYLEELFNDSGVDLEETAYWFHTPPGGWNTKPAVRKAAEEAPVTFPEPWHGEEDASGRKPLAEVKEGTVITGTITDCWLYHGLQIDFGAEFDGLVPIPQEVWMEPGVRETLLPGDTVTARVAKIRRPGLYRWPIQLQLEKPAAIAAMLPPPETYQAPIDHGWCMEQGWEYDDICKATGRTFEPAVYQLPYDHQVDMEGAEMAFGYDDTESTFGIEDPYAYFIMNPVGQAQIADSVASVGY